MSDHLRILEEDGATKGVRCWACDTELKADQSGFWPCLTCFIKDLEEEFGPLSEAEKFRISFGWGGR